MSWANQSSTGPPQGAQGSWSGGANPQPGWNPSRGPGGSTTQPPPQAGGSWGPQSGGPSQPGSWHQAQGSGPPAQQGSWHQQQPAGPGGWGQQQPPGPGGWGQQGGYGPQGGYGQQGGYAQPGCCPQGGGLSNPADPCCPSGEGSMFFACEQQCDAAVWLAALLFVLSILGFGLVVGLKKPDDLFSYYGVKGGNALDLDAAMHWDRLSSNRTVPFTPAPPTEAPTTTPAPCLLTCAPCTSGPTTLVPLSPTTGAPPTQTPDTAAPPTAAPASNGATTATTSATPSPLTDAPPTQSPDTGSPATDAPTDAPTEEATASPGGSPGGRRFDIQADADTYPPVTAETCTDFDALTGTFGKLCMPNTLEATPMLMNISRWVNFRATLYWLAMMATILTCIVIFVVHRARNPPQLQQYAVGPPVQFNGTPLYHVFRTAWFVSGLMIFFWICTEMYQYWWFIGYYQNTTRGRLRAFWIAFDKKHVTAVVFVGVYLCWPLCNLILEIVFWLLLIIPWFGYRALCSPGLESTRMPPETELQDIPFCIRMDMFFTECHQFTRVGFATKLWQMVTGSREPWLDFCSQAPGGMPPGGWQGPPQHAQPSGWSAPPAQPGPQPPRPGSMGQEMRPAPLTNQSQSATFESSRTLPPSGMLASTTSAPGGSTPTRVTTSGNFGQVQVSQSWGGPEMSQSLSVPESPSKKKKKDKHSHSHSEAGDGSDEERKKKKKEKKKDKEKA